MNRSEILAILDRAVTEANGRPIVLNTYCCQGGSAAGYEAADFYVLGVDIADQPRYPFLFIQADVLEFLAEFAEWIREHVVLVDASPPCQGYSDTQRINDREWPRLIAPTRVLLLRIGVPYVIENVEGARRELVRPVTLCGAMFGLHTYRHRLFETGGWSFAVPEHPVHVAKQTKLGRPIPAGEFGQYVGNFSGVEAARQDLGVPWMNRDGIRECVPPAYTRCIGARFLAQQPAAVAA